MSELLKYVDIAIGNEEDAERFSESRLPALMSLEERLKPRNV